MTKLFHREVFMPANIANLREVQIAPSVTAHASRAAVSDRYGKLEIPATVTFSGADIIEAETTHGKLSKVVVRLPYDSTRDAVYVIGIKNGETFYKTVWFNCKNDGHKTLKRHLYATA